LNRTILLVDEHLDILARISTFLEDFGFIVEIAPSRNEALGKVKTFDPGLLIVSHQLPDGDALTLIEDLRRFYESQAPVIVMASAKEIDFYRRKPEGKLAQGWIKWPVDNMELYNEANNLLGQSIDPAEVTGHKSAKPTSRPLEQSTPLTSSPQRPTVRAAKPKPRPGGGDVDAEKFGNLARTPVARLLKLLASRHETGVLTINHPPRQVVVHLENGVMVNVDSNYIPDLSLGVMLAKKGVLTTGELSGARNRWNREGGLFGQTLLNMQLVKDGQLNTSLLEQRLKKVLSLFDWHWRTGTFKLQRDPSQVKAVPGFRLRIEPAVIEGIRTCYDQERLMMVLGKKNRLNTPVTLSTTAAKDLTGAAGSGDLQNVIDALRAGKTVNRAMMVSGLNELTMFQYVYALYVLDVLHFNE
jgi:CheY-like chemotaxis protein